MTEKYNNTSKLQQWLEKIWYGNGRGRFLLLPLSALYCTINTLQRKRQSMHLPTLPCPVVVVGNMTVGGTGKTPLTIHIIKLLQQQGYTPAIITRGYGGKATTWPQAVTARSDPQQVGDEAVLMAIRTGVPVYAGANRLASIEALLKAHECDVIVSDDGLQHYKLPRDIAIAVVDGERGLGNGLCLPAGPLREKKERLEGCDFVLLNGKSNLKTNLNNQSYNFMLKGDLLYSLHGNKQLNLDALGAQSVHAVTGIGHPERFYSTLEQGGLRIIKHSFPDHHDYKASDLRFADDHPIVMTEKDAVKCKHLALTEPMKQHCWYLPVNAAVDDGFDQVFLKRLKNITEK